jgi:hypothetical protein
MNTCRIAFQTSDFCPKKELFTFRCITHGFANQKNWVNPDEGKSACWDEELNGTILSGKYDEVLTRLQSLDFKPKLCIAIFARNVGVELFINHFNQLMPDVILAGGVAAIPDIQVSNELVPLSEDIRLLAVSEDRFEFHSLNIYEKTGMEVEIKKTSDRDFELLRIIPGGNWLNAVDFYRQQQKMFDIECSNFESLTFSDRNERNLHFSIVGNSMHAGAILPDDNILHLRLISEKDAEERVADFITDKRSLIFGCAGIRSLIQKPLYTGANSLAGFMFGEIVSQNNKAILGNLMLAKIKMLEKVK